MTGRRKRWVRLRRLAIFCPSGLDPEETWYRGYRILLPSPCDKYRMFWLFLQLIFHLVTHIDFFYERVAPAPRSSVACSDKGWGRGAGGVSETLTKYSHLPARKALLHRLWIVKSSNPRSHGTSEVNKWPAAKPHRSMGHVWPGKIGSLEAVRGQRSMATWVFEVKKF